MNELPTELKCIIFQYLDLTDLFDPCRLVCKNWLKLIDSMKFNELIVSNFYKNYSNDKFKNFWFYTFQPINPANLVYIHDECSFNRSFVIKHYFNNLKYFRIYFDQVDDYFFNEKNKVHQIWFNLDQLNNFINLEHLEIMCKSFKTTTETLTLYLPNLRILKLGLGLGIGYDQLVVDAVKLEVLRCNIDQIELVHPESIKFLGSFGIPEMDLNRFSNLKNLLIHLTFYLPEPQIVLSNLPYRLEQLHLKYGINIGLTRLSKNDVREKFKNISTSLFREIESSLRTNLKIYLNGIELKSNKPFHEYGFDLKPLELYKKNYGQLLHTLSYFTDLGFNDLIESFNNSIPDNFFSIFNNIQAVQAKGVNQDLFTLFLNGCKNLNKLSLYKNSFNQQFYDQLPKIANLLIELVLKKIVQIDLKFISEFKILSTVYTDQNIPKQLVLYLITNMNFLKTLEYQINGEKVIINKIPRTYKLKIQFPGYFNYKPKLGELHYDEIEETNDWVIL